MLFPEKKILLKNGTTAVFRSPHPADAKQMLQYLKDTSGETPFLLRTPEECDMSLEQEEAFLRSVAESESSIMILCIVEGNLAGNCHLSRHTKKKNAHRGDVAIALYKEFWGLGIGSAMFQEMIAIANQWGLMQLELEVIEGNQRAMNLYHKMGFETISFVPNAIRLEDGTLLKEYRMLKLL